MTSLVRLRPTPVLLLGTFHFEDEGRDRYKPQHRFEVSERQADILEVIGRLEAFRPTKIAVEFDAPQQSAVDRNYAAFVRGERELSGMEQHQLGFRLAARLGHERVYAANAWGRFYEPQRDLDLEASTGHQGPFYDPHTALKTYAQEHGQERLIGPWVDFYMERFAALDEKKTRQPLRETLLEMNESESIVSAHGVYLVDYFDIGVDHEYPGVDYTTSWYNRNLRIFANLQRITQPPNERLLVIYGFGHTSILRHCFEASPKYELIEVGAYL